MHNGLVCIARSAQRGKHKSHTHTASLSIIIHYTRRNAHTGDETFKKGVVVDSLGLKYKHIFKNGQQKKFSTKRLSKNGQPNWNTAEFLKFGRKMVNLATLELELTFVQMFRACIQTFFITFRVTMFFFCDTHLLCSPRWLLWLKWFSSANSVCKHSCVPAFAVGLVSHSF